MTRLQCQQLPALMISYLCIYGSPAILI